MSFEQYAAYTTAICPAGFAVYGITTNVQALFGTKSTCLPLNSPSNECAVAGSFSDTHTCSNGAQDLVNQMHGPVLTINVYSDAACGSPVQTIAAVLNKCICLITPDVGTYFNAVFSVSKNGTVEVAKCNIDECILSTNNLNSTFPRVVPQCTGQAASVIGQCDKVSEECLHAFSNKYNGFTLGSFKYDQAVPVLPVTKSHALSVGGTFVSVVAALLLF